MINDGKPARGRPRNQSRRDAILEAAIKLFANRGYHGTSMRDIAAEANMPAPLLRHYFNRKTDILEALRERAKVFDDAIARAGEALRGCRSSYACLRQVGGAYVKYTSEMSAFYAVWIQQPELFQASEHTLANQSERIQTSIAKVLASMPDFAGTEEDALLAVRTLWGTLFYSTFLRARIGLELPAKRDTDAFVDSVARLIARSITRASSTA